ncbi:hypothetical protein [uncultured Tateyamaria sp.]|uniref:hypothetical protein n=1 Tax=uncultured Tateyamaria sp. TaxID=455651 RepID=UPI00261A98B7|nr:hypothetical protein [uncultured Tateyamaria sp.]
MFRSCRPVLTGFVAAMALHSAPAALAQGLEIAPIGFDVADEGDNLVVASFVADAAPVFDAVQLGATPAAARVSAGLPQPSIILGLIAPGQEEEFGLENLLPATVEQVSFSLDDLAAREAMRENDPILFERLIQEGHLDPDADVLPTVLQTELARMNCYRSGIDGAWGPGSRRSVGEYFEQLASVDWPDQAPTQELFRAIILNGDVACPTPVAVQRAAPARTTSRPASTTTRTQPRAAAPAPAPKPAAKPKPKLSIGGSGVLR